MVMLQPTMLSARNLDHRATSAVIAAQNEALTGFKHAIWQMQDRYAVQCSQAEQMHSDALAMVASLQAQLSEQNESLPRVAHAAHDQAAQHARGDARQILEPDRAPAPKAH